MTNGNDPIHQLTWVARPDGVPELNTKPNGLTKREYFAAMAMQELIQRKRMVDQKIDVAIECVLYADALIKALNKIS